ncbi:MAG: hypothetical protein M3458_05370 [Acidobacteriota bacterium]|nr:hypothetical protein [Acidobacteriota bacterium]
MTAVDVPARGDGLASEYLEIGFDVGLSGATDAQDYPEGVADPYSFAPQHLSIEIPDDVQLAWDELLLGSRARRVDPAWRSLDQLDPFGTTRANGSERKLSHCLPIWFGLAQTLPYTASDGYHNDLFDLILTSTSDASIVKTFPNAVVRETVREIRRWADSGSPGWSLLTILANAKWTKRKTRAADAGERWSAWTLAEQLAFESGYQDTRGVGGRYHVRLDARLQYEAFDTADTVNFKVTREARFGAAEVIDFALSTSAPARVFLKPQWLAFSKVHSYLYTQPISYQFTGTVDGITGEPIWDTYTTNVLKSASLRQGFHAGRLPVIPHALTSGWDSLSTFSGDTSFTRRAEIYNLDVLYDALVASAKTGRTTRLFFGGDQTPVTPKGTAAYDRHPSRDSVFYVYKVTPADALALYGAHGIALATLRTIKGEGMASGVSYPVAGLLATLDAQASADVSTVLAGLNALAEVQNAVRTGATVAGVLRDAKTVDVIQPTARPAGSLVGVIETGGAFYYVWRRVALTLAARDWSRDQGSWVTGWTLLDARALV